MVVLVFDTETTGLLEGRLARVKLQPHVIQFASRLMDLDSGEVIEDFSCLVKPPISLPDKIVKITGHTDEILAREKPFSHLADKIIGSIESAPQVVAHNLAFDRDVLNFEAARVGRKISWPKSFCTVEQTVHLLGYQADLTKLHELLFGRAFDSSHTASGDVAALSSCLVEMRKRGMV